MKYQLVDCNDEQHLTKRRIAKKKTPLWHNPCSTIRQYPTKLSKHEHKQLHLQLNSDYGSISFSRRRLRSMLTREKQSNYGFVKVDTWKLKEAKLKHSKLHSEILNSCANTFDNIISLPMFKQYCVHLVLISTGLHNYTILYINFS